MAQTRMHARRHTHHFHHDLLLNSIVLGERYRAKLALLHINLNEINSFLIYTHRLKPFCLYLNKLFKIGGHLFRVIINTVRDSTAYSFFKDYFQNMLFFFVLFFFIIFCSNLFIFYRWMFLFYNLLYAFIFKTLDS